MPVAGTFPGAFASATPMRLLRTADLKLRLALRVMALSLLCFGAAAAYVLIDADRAARAKIDWTAEIVAKDLQLQQERVLWASSAPGQFPDLQNIATAVMTPGLCIAYRAKSGDTVQRLCSGTPRDESDAPRLFADIYRSLFDPGREIARNVFFRGELEGAAIVSVDPERLIALAWRETSRLLAVMAMTLLCLCVLTYGALARVPAPDAHDPRRSRTPCRQRSYDAFAALRSG